MSQWSRCDACGGKLGVMRRKIQCVRTGAHVGDDNVKANFDACKGKPPIQTRECIGNEPCGQKNQRVTGKSDNATFALSQNYPE